MKLHVCSFKADSSTMDRLDMDVSPQPPDYAGILAEVLKSSPGALFLSMEITRTIGAGVLLLTGEDDDAEVELCRLWFKRLRWSPYAPKPSPPLEIIPRPLAYCVLMPFTPPASKKAYLQDFTGKIACITAGFFVAMRT